MDVAAINPEVLSSGHTGNARRHYPTASDVRTMAADQCTVGLPRDRSLCSWLPMLRSRAFSSGTIVSLLQRAGDPSSLEILRAFNLDVKAVNSGVFWALKQTRNKV